MNYTCPHCGADLNYDGFVRKTSTVESEVMVINDNKLEVDYEYPPTYDHLKILGYACSICGNNIKFLLSKDQETVEIIKA